MSNKLYDVLKWIAQYLLPSLGTLYFALAGIWGLPYGEQIIGTITALDIFLGVLLGISSSQYAKSNASDGELLIDTSGSSDIYRLELGTTLDALGDKKTITLNVRSGHLIN